MKFQDSSFNGLKVTVGTKSVTHPPTQACTLQKQYAQSTFFKVGGINTCHIDGHWLEHPLRYYAYAIYYLLNGCKNGRS